MLSRLFLIPTLLLVGITTIAIGAPVAETTEIIKAVEFPQMGSGNLALNRRFINGVPGLPQCPDPNYPYLFFSYCETPVSIYARCTGNGNGDNIVRTPCPPKTFCMDFVSVTTSLTPPGFAMCVDDDDVKKFGNNGKDGVFCKNYKMDGVTGGTATVSMTIVDGSERPIKVRGLSYSSGNQSGSKQNTYNFSSIVNAQNGQKIKVCVETGITVSTTAMFTYLNGEYGSS